MSFVFRRPHDFRPVPVAVAALFGGPATVDDPPLERSYVQERFYAAVRPAWPYQTSGAGLSAALFPAAPASEDPPIQWHDPQRLFWAALRPQAHPPAGPRQLPFVTETDMVSGQGVEQLLFHAAYRSQRWALQPPQHPAALFPTAEPDGPPIPGLVAQEAFHAGFRQPWYRPDFRGLDPALFPIDDPPFTRSGAVDAYWAAHRPPWARPLLPALDPALFPVVTPDDPPLEQALIQELFHAARKKPWFDPRRAFPRLFESFLVGTSGDCPCNIPLLQRFDTLDTAVAAVQAAVDANNLILLDVQAAVAVILASLSGTISIQGNESKKIFDLLTRLEQKVNLMRTAMEKKGTKS